MAAWKERERQTDPPVGGSGEEGANLPGKSAGKGLGRKEWRAQGGWGVGAELGGERVECARGSSLATPTPPARGHLRPALPAAPQLGNQEAGCPGFVCAAGIIASSASAWTAVLDPEMWPL